VTAGLLGVTGPDVTLRSSLDDRLLSKNDGNGDSRDLKSCVDQGRRLVAVSGQGPSSTVEMLATSPVPFWFSVNV